MTMQIHPLLQPYLPIISFLSNSLGEYSEISLHAVTNHSYKLIAIENSQKHGVKIGDDSSHWFTSISEYINCKQSEFLCNYKIKHTKERTVRASYYFIRDNKCKLIGILCIHSDISYLEKALEFLQTITHCTNSKESLLSNSTSADVVVKKCCSNDNLENIVHAQLTKKSVSFDRMTPDEKLEFIHSLYNLDVFTIKNSVPRVSALLHISEPTIYRYLQKIKCKTNKKTK